MMWNPLLAHEYHMLPAKQQQPQQEVHVASDSVAEQDQQQQQVGQEGCVHVAAKQIAGVGAASPVLRSAACLASI